MFLYVLLAVATAQAVEIWQPGKDLINADARGIKWPVDDGAGRIVGGEDAVISDNVWQVSLRSSSGSHICGGAIVNENWIVTAAHCTQGSGYSIRAGSTSRLSGGQIRSVSEVFNHPQYNQGQGTFPNDISLLKLSSPLSLNGDVGSIDLADGTTNFQGVMCRITGWGRTCGSCGLPTNLKGLDIMAIGNSECKNRWSSAQIIDGHICVFNENAPDGACNGDSGGPLVCNGQLAGVTSWGANGCPGTTPSVYTRISVYKSWVESIMGPS